jgi:hypothetical protein
MRGGRAISLDDEKHLELRRLICIEMTRLIIRWAVLSAGAPLLDDGQLELWLLKIPKARIIRVLGDGAAG